jgi:hypothetical protein
MSCLTAEAHINIILSCPHGLMTQDTVHLIGYQQMAVSLLYPLPTDISSKQESYQCSRQQMEN